VSGYFFLNTVYVVKTNNLLIVISQGTTSAAVSGN